MRVDSFVGVLMMSSLLDLPRRFHLEQVLKMLGYLKKHNNAEMVFDQSEPYVSHEDFNCEDLSSSIYREIK